MTTRLTHNYDDGVVVFRIGMTIAKRHRPDLWLPVFTAMPRMITELTRNRDAAARGEARDLGFIGAEFMLGGGGPWVQQWWRSAEQLLDYAHSTQARHLPAWKSFNKAARRSPGAVGIWHETYVVPAEGIETFYGNGAIVGLGKLLGTQSVARRGDSARERLTAATRTPA